MEGARLKLLKCLWSHQELMATDVVRGQGLLKCWARRYVRTSLLAGFLREERIEKKISKFS